MISAAENDPEAKEKLGNFAARKDAEMSKFNDVLKKLDDAQLEVVGDSIELGHSFVDDLTQTVASGKEIDEKFIGKYADRFASIVKRAEASNLEKFGEEFDFPRFKIGGPNVEIRFN